MHKSNKDASPIIEDSFRYTFEDHNSMESHQGPEVYLTLDFEEDLGSAAREITFYSHRKTDKLIQYVKDHNLKITLFVTGQILDEHKELIQPYQANPDYFQFELHSYNHTDVYASIEKRIDNMKRGLDVFRRYFDRSPLIYRAPDGVTSRRDIEVLIQHGIRYGSNIFPAFFPGRFNNLHVPRKPFKLKDIDFVEIPLSVTKYMRIPISLSHMHLVGFSTFRFLFSLEKMNDVLIDFHLHDIFPDEWYQKQRLSTAFKVAYWRGSKEKRTYPNMKTMIGYFENTRSKFLLMKDLIEKIQVQAQLPEHDIGDIYQ